jgi:hypothetical protein
MFSRELRWPLQVQVRAKELGTEKEKTSFHEKKTHRFT